MTHKDQTGDILQLLEIMQRLRAPDGCPWDAEQTPESLTSYIQEEACELIDAIEQHSTEHVLDELGDLLLQVVFVAQIYKEREAFQFSDVVARISDKLIRRHPHVFDQADSSTRDTDLVRQWEQIKQAESTGKKSCLADHLPSRLPALQRAQKLLARLERDHRGAELPDLRATLAQVLTTVEHFPERPIDPTRLGNLLFTLVRVAQSCGIDAESALRIATHATLADLDN